MQPVNEGPGSPPTKTLSQPSDCHLARLPKSWRTDFGGSEVEHPKPLAERTRKKVGVAYAITKAENDEV